MSTNANSPFSERLRALELTDAITTETGLPGHVISAIVMGYPCTDEQASAVWDAVSLIEKRREIQEAMLDEYCWEPGHEGGWFCKQCRAKKKGEQR